VPALLLLLVGFPVDPVTGSTFFGETRRGGHLCLLRSGREAYKLPVPHDAKSNLTDDAIDENQVAKGLAHGER
jgi:hypothetical protein